MTSRDRSPHLAPGSAFLIGLLVMLVGLSAVLAYQAVEAARSETRATERALRGYASVASWELERRAEVLLHRQLVALLDDALAADPQDPAALAAAATRATRSSQASAVRGAFRLAPSGAATIANAWAASPELTRWLRGAAQRLSARTGSNAGDGRARALARGDERYILVFERSGSAGSDTIWGLALDAARAIVPAVEATYREGSLAPSTAVATGARVEPIVTVLGPAGLIEWHSALPKRASRDGGWINAKVGAYPPEPLGRGQVVRSMSGLLDGFTSRVSVPADALSEAPDGVPGSRLPLLLTVFGLTVGLACVAIFQLRRQQELTRLRQDFVVGVSHELRTPLAQIRLFSDLLESGRLPTAEQRMRSVRTIAEESRRLSWLVENVLHFSRAPHDDGRLRRSQVRWAPLAREIVEAFAPLARSRHVDFVVEADERACLRADPDALRQVLLNLLDNAVKYGPPGQTVRVTGELRDSRLLVTVVDGGPGVPAEERERVWQPYRRLAREAGNADGGCGIGLAVVKDLVELHGGRVGVSDAPGGGSSFWALFPGATLQPLPSRRPEPDSAEVAT